jgi:hypothetical protein
MHLQSYLSMATVNDLLYYTYLFLLTFLLTFLPVAMVKNVCVCVCSTNSVSLYSGRSLHLQLCLTEGELSLIMLNHAEQCRHNHKPECQSETSTNQYRIHAEPVLTSTRTLEPCRALGPSETQQGVTLAGPPETCGRATYHGTSLVATIPRAWGVFGPFCHFAL